MGRADSPSVSVVIPARNEEHLLPSALAALNMARHRAPNVRVHVTVVADACSDRTAEIAASAGASVLETTAGNVGAARAAGFIAALDRHGGSVRGHWLATTDADSVVPPHWINAQLHAARHGYQVFLGTVRLPPAVELAFPTWVRQYLVDATRTHEHGHVHGANLGMDASTYAAVGGFHSLAVGEDADLVHRARLLGARLAWRTDAAVMTSPRLAARAPGGVARDLARSRF